MDSSETANPSASIEKSQPLQTPNSAAAVSAPAAAPGTDEPPKLTPRQIIIVFSGLATAMFLASLDTTIVSTALPRILEELNGSAIDFTWIIASYLLASTATQPVYGKLSDIFGCKQTLLFAILLFMLGSLLCGLANDTQFLIGGRTVQGLGAGGLMTLVLIIISEIVSLQERGKYQGIIGATFGLSSIIGPLMGGAFTDKVSWRWAFLINLPFGAMSLVIITVFLHLKAPQSTWRQAFSRIDLMGIALLIAAVCLLVMGLEWGGATYPWNSGPVVGCIVGSVVVAVVFAGWQLYLSRHHSKGSLLMTAEPVLEPSLFLIRNFSLAVVGQFFFGAVMYAMLYYLPLYFEKIDQSSATAAGLQLIPAMMGFVFFSIGSGILVAKTGNYIWFPRLGPMFILLGSGLLSTLNTSVDHVKEVFFMLIFGAGLGLVMQPMLLSVQAAVQPRQIGIATAALTFFRTIGSVVGIAIMQSILTNVISADMSASLQDFYATNGNSPSSSSQSGDPGIGDDWSTIPEPFQSFIKSAFVHGLQVIFLTCIGFAAITLISCWLLENVPLKRPGTAASKPANDRNAKTDKGQEQVEDTEIVVVAH